MLGGGLYMSFEFFITSLIVVLLPGTGVIYTVYIGLNRGFAMSVAAATGCTLGILPAAFASIIGLAALLHTSALAYSLVKYLGVAYLLFMAWSFVRDAGAMKVEADQSPTSAWRVVISGILLNALNPKLSLFFLAFLPQFVPAGAAPVQLVPLAGAFMALTFVVFVGYGAFASLVRDYVFSRPMVMAWLRRSFGAIFALLGAKLAVSD